MPPEKPDVSVVVPIYNVESYLRECVDSILAQTHANIEVILVNDGSTDGSLEIIREYEATDSRVQVIDKPNGGYGHSVNRGIEAATGTWLSIIEPDDIVDARMYADLLANSLTDDGENADIVKSSYWLYYDHEDGTEPYTDIPNLMQYMPRERTELAGDSMRELLFHHPSIWSAIYRREFIEDCQIRMIEPKGAGWADNPWFFDTMLRAKSIVWWPRAYYYYRQTNPNASSKSPALDLPFDRLRDMRKILANLGADENPDVVLPFYNRSFCYILDSVLDEYGYPENDPEVQTLIREVLESMDEDTVLEAEFGIPNAHKSYYKDVTGIHLDRLVPAPAPSNPFLSIVLAMQDDAQLLWPTILSLTGQKFRNFEVICVDAGCRNRFPEIVAAVAKIDQRFSLVTPGEDSTVADAFNAGLASARGEYVQFWRPGVTYPWKTDLEHIAAQVREKRTYVDSRKPWTPKTESLLPSTPFATRPGAPDVIATTEKLLVPLLPANAGEFMEVKVACIPADKARARLVALGGLEGFGRMFRRSMLAKHSITFPQDDDYVRAFSLAGLDAAEIVTVVRGGSPDTTETVELERHRLNHDNARDVSGPALARRIHVIANQISELSDLSAGYAALIAEFKNAHELVFSRLGGPESFAAVAPLFHKFLGNADLSGLPIEQFEDYEKLRRFFAVEYEAALQNEVSLLSSDTQAQHIANLEKALRIQENKNRAIRASRSFRVGRALTVSAKRTLPASAIKHLKAKLR